jgi:restriction endonuclease Mrr
MAIPDYQSIMLPLLRVASDGNEHQISEATQTKLRPRRSLAHAALPNKRTFILRATGTSHTSIYTRNAWNRRSDNSKYLRAALTARHFAADFRSRLPNEDFRNENLFVQDRPS